MVTHASESLQPIFGADAQTVIGRPLSELMSRHTIHRLRNILQFVMANGEPERLMNLAMGYKRERFDLALYADQSRAVIEIKPRQPGQKSADDAFFLLRAMRARVRSATSPMDVCVRAARQSRSLTGFDRVGIFRFREDGTSEIVADEHRSDGASSSGLLYGVNETNMLARDLVKGARFAYIPDTSYVPSPIMPGPVAQGELHGLNALGLQCISPAHAAYLQQCGIGSVFALPIGPIDAPWGGMVCVNAEPRFIPFETRGAIEFFVNGIALQIGLLGAAETFGTHMTARKARSEVLIDPALEIDPEENLQGFADALGRHVAFDGIGYWNGRGFAAAGQVPSPDAVHGLIAKLDAVASVVQSHDDLGVSAEGGGLTGLGGVLAVRLGRQPNSYLMLFRKETVRPVRWAQPGQLAPVREEMESGRSLPWSRVDVEVAHSLRSLLLDLKLRRLDRDEEDNSVALHRQEFLIKELNHRIKNLLALFQSLVAKTAETSDTLEGFVETLAGRVRSLALAHDQINGHGVSSVPLRSLVEAEVAPYLTSQTAIEIEGPDIAFSSHAFAVVALVMHELATNAAKYGALSQASGKLAVRWARNEDGAVRLDWREHCVAPISPPKRRGFGSTVVERMIPFELRGAVNLDYLTHGLSATFKIPSEFVEDQLVDVAQPRRPLLSPEVFTADHALRALVVEDNMIIALEAEDMLRRLGFLHVDIAARCEDARSFLGEGAFDIVVLDVNLGGETSFPLAEQLAKAGTPYFFATGYGEQSIIPDHFSHVPIVAKPYSEASLSAALSQYLGRCG